MSDFAKDTNVLTNDCISREAARRAVRKLYIKEVTTDDCAFNMAIDQSDDVIRKLPSAERRGRWIRTGEDGYCSVCKCDMPMFRDDWGWEYTETPYCPNCGSRMYLDEVTE